jgi:chemotaxis methyl-accepting protein methylase
MHKLVISSTILEHELSELRLLIERQTGILLDCPNSALSAHVADFAESREMASAGALLDVLRSCDQDPATLPQFLDGLLNANTGFFRHQTAMNALTRQALPQLYGRKSGEGPCALRIWSAGCSTGEEAYSIAMAICDAFPGNGATNGPTGNNGVSSGSNGKDKSKENKASNGTVRNGGVADAGLTTPGVIAAPTQPAKDWSIHIVGSDLLPSNIEAAERGVYPQSALAGLPASTIRSCFSKIGSAMGSASGAPTVANGFQFGVSNAPSTGVAPRAAAPGLVNGSANASHLLVKPRLRSLVTFNTMNLAKPVYIGRFDCIFCMDVLPHLSRTQRIALVERLHLYLEPGGYLFLGQTEKLCAPNLNFRAESFDGYTFHRKPLAASAAYGR